MIFPILRILFAKFDNPAFFRSMKKSAHMPYGLPILISIFIFIFIAPSCYYDNEKELYPYEGLTVCDTVAISFSQTVVPILVRECYVCHAASTRLGNISVEGHGSVKALAENGKLLGAIKHEPGFSQMPKGGNKLPDCEIRQIEAWVDQGKLDN